MPTNNKKQKRKTPVKKCIQLYLLGVLSSKVSFNDKYRRIFVQFPITKSKLAYSLKEQFGGSVYEKPYDGNKSVYTCYEIKAKGDLKKLREVVNKLSSELPPEFFSDLLGYLDTVV